MPDPAHQSARLLGPSAAVLSWLGLWRHPGRPPSRGLGPLGAAFIVAVNVAACVDSITQMIVDTPTDPVLFREVFFICSCCFSWSVRVVSFLLHRKRLQRMVVSLLDARRRFPDSGAGIREKFRRTGSTVWTVWQVLPGMALSLWVGDPLIRNMTSSGAENGTRALVFWMPVDVQRSPAYEITYAVQAVGTAAVGETSLLLDVFFVVLFLLAASEIAVLNENVAQMGFPKLRCRENGSGREKGVQPPEGSAGGERRWNATYAVRSRLPVPDGGPYGNGDVSIPDRGDTQWELYNTLVKNIRHHQFIMAYVQDLQVVLNTSVYLMLLANALNVCLHSFGFVALFQEGATLSTVIKEVLSFQTFVGQTALHCFFGQLIIDQAERLQSSAFGCNWPHADEPFRRSLRILMLQATRPLDVKVGKLVTLSRSSFLQVLNASYTIFNMMFNIEKPN